MLKYRQLVLRRVRTVINLSQTHSAATDNYWDILNTCEGNGLVAKYDCLICMHLVERKLFQMDSNLLNNPMLQNCTGD